MQLSNYFVLQDNNFELAEGNIKRFTASMPPPSQFRSNTARPLLWFNMQPLTSGRLKFIVILNDPQGNPNNIPDNKVVFNYDFASNSRELRSIHEVLDGSKFSSNDNFIDFRVIVGRIRLSDIILFFRVET